MKRIRSKTFEKTFFPLKPYLLQWKPVVASGVLKSFKLLCMSSLPANMKRYSKNSRENVMTSFSTLLVYGIFFIRSRAANSVVCSRIRPNFELIQAVMHVIVTYKYEKDPIKSIRENLMTPFFPLKVYGSYPLRCKPEF